MDQNITPEVLRFAPKQKPRDEIGQLDETGQALVAMLREAASISKGDVERAMSMAHKLSIQLRDAEERIVLLQDELKNLQTRAATAEHWLETIKNEIQNKLINPLEANNRPGPNPRRSAQ
jgi:DNA transposition AAA+ family ATPase